MKVLLVNSVCGVGSTGKICVDIAKLITQNGDDCVIAYGRGEAKGYDKTYKITSSLGNKWHFLKSRLFDGHGLSSYFETKRFVKFIKKYNPDVIHLHNIHGYYLNYKVLFKFLQTYTGKVVWTMHDMWAVTGHCAYVYDCEKWHHECHHCGKLCDYPKTKLDRSKRNFYLKKELFTSMKNLTIVTVSQWLKDEFKKSYFKDCDIRVVNNGINLELFSPIKNEFKKKNNLQDKKIFLGLANIWDERKGFNDFIELSKMLNDDEKLVMVGLSEEQKNNLPENIFGITRTDNQKQLVEIYSDSDLFLNLTYSDNFPTVNIESLACGTPVLTYKTGGSPEMLTDETGFVIEQGKIDEVLKVLRKFKKTEKVEKNCLKQASLYAKEDRFKEYLEIYK